MVTQVALKPGGMECKYLKWHCLYVSKGKGMLHSPVLTGGCLLAYELKEEVFILITALFPIFCFSWSDFFIHGKLSEKGKPESRYKSHLMWCSSWGITLIYNIPGLESAYVPVWYWKTSVKNKVHKNLPFFNKQTNKKLENPPERVSFHWCWRLPVGLQFWWTVPLQCLFAVFCLYVLNFCEEKLSSYQKLFKSYFPLQPKLINLTQFANRLCNSAASFNASTVLGVSHFLVWHWSCSLLTPRYHSKKSVSYSWSPVRPFFWVLPALPHAQGSVGGCFPSLTQRVPMCSSLPSSSGHPPTNAGDCTAFLPLSFFPCSLALFLIRLQSVKMMLTLTGAVARAEISQKHLSAGRQ